MSTAFRTWYHFFGCQSKMPEVIPVGVQERKALATGMNKVQSLSKSDGRATEPQGTFCCHVATHGPLVDPAGLVFQPPALQFAGISTLWAGAVQLSQIMNYKEFDQQGTAGQGSRQVLRGSSTRIAIESHDHTAISQADVRYALP